MFFCVLRKFRENAHLTSFKGCNSFKKCTAQDDTDIMKNVNIDDVDFYQIVSFHSKYIAHEVS